MTETEFQTDLLAAEQGDADAQYQLGDAYYYGTGVKRDYVEAITWYWQAANQEHAEAQYNLALAYYEGEGLVQDYAQAVTWWEKAAIRGHVDAQYELGKAYTSGEGVAPYDTQAIYWLEQAAKQGHPDAQYELGVHYKDKEDRQATYWWKKAANQGHDDAQYELGLAYYEGKGVEKSYEKAVDWWDKATKQGHSESQYRLWYKKAERGDIKAQYRLGNAYSEGWGNKKPDEAKAIEWWQKAAKQGHLTAQYNLGVVYRKAKDHQNALQYFDTVAKHTDKGNALVISAQYLLGIMYKKGEGCVQDFQKARKWLSLARGIKKEEVEGFPKSENDFLKVVLDEDNIQEELITIVQISAQEALEDIAKLEEKENAKKELEDIMAMFAHKFRGPLLNIQYNANHKNQKARTLKAVQTMTALLDIFSTISIDDIKLREKISQDKRGDRTLTDVLVDSLLLAIPQLLIARHIERIKQHYLSYAKKTGQIPSTATWEQLSDDYLDILENLQIEWENSFMALVDESDNLTEISIWIRERFFPIQLQGFDNNPIYFKRYGATESVLIIVMTEMLLNGIKYYNFNTGKELPIIVSWECQQDTCQLICENPTTQMESNSSKGTHKGQNFLNVIARKLEGNFTTILKQNRYTAKFNLPRHLLIEEKI